MDEWNCISAYTLPTHLVYPLDTKAFQIYKTKSISSVILSTYVIFKDQIFKEPQD